MEKSERKLCLSPKQRRRQDWGFRVAWVKGQTGGGIVRGLGPGRNGGTCDVFGEVRVYDDLKGFVFIRNGEILHAVYKRQGFFFLCQLSEVQAIWRLRNGEADKLIFRQRQV